LSEAGESHASVAWQNSCREAEVPQRAPDGGGEATLRSAGVSGGTGTGNCSIRSQPAWGFGLDRWADAREKLR
jgi:hypothetical protein